MNSLMAKRTIDSECQHPNKKSDKKELKKREQKGTNEKSRSHAFMHHP